MILTNTMVVLISLDKAKRVMAERIKAHRISQGFTQDGLAKRAGVSLSTLRKFEQKGKISLEGYLQITMALGLVERVAEAIGLAPPAYKSIDEVIALNKQTEKVRKRGWRR